MENPKKFTVMVVEDEPLIRLLTSDALRDGGFDVVEAADAEEALHKLQACIGLDVLFTDINMPGKSGLELAQIVHRLMPHVHLLLASGYERPSPQEIPSDGTFLKKPYQPEAIVERVRRLVA